MNLITSWVSLKFHNYIDGAQTAELSSPEMKQKFENIMERRYFKIAVSLKRAGVEAKLND